ncbi:invasion associated locus B family protein [Methylocystis hirsuta]|uniref:Invasion associated locus B family protein n=1 Tax=Methylocystis hirsuta TaxID=369798 RepID=A0A3M9XIS5_9HYPH|nr:invasion associated locus B family protein [Methylocystis hirsuta]RNJ48023.1 invasion associated locus B family protein [Methylocystis hirsuta]
MKLFALDPNSFLHAIATGMCVALLFGSIEGFAWGQEAGKTKFGAWELRCETPVGGSSEQCVLTQMVRAEDTANVNLGVMILKPREVKGGVLRILAPMNVFLPNGVSLKIDQTDIGRVGFVRCAPSDCIADAPIEDKLLDQLETGKIATLVVYMTPYEGVRNLFSLEGFKQGYERLR